MHCMLVVCLWHRLRNVVISPMASGQGNGTYLCDVRVRVAKSLIFPTISLVTSASRWARPCAPKRPMNSVRHPSTKLHNFDITDTPQLSTHSAARKLHRRAAFHPMIHPVRPWCFALCVRCSAFAFASTVAGALPRPSPCVQLHTRATACATCTAVSGTCRTQTVSPCRAVHLTCLPKVLRTITRVREIQSLQLSSPELCQASCMPSVRTMFAVPLQIRSLAPFCVSCVRWEVTRSPCVCHARCASGTWLVLGFSCRTRPARRRSLELSLLTLISRECAFACALQGTNPALEQLARCASGASTAVLVFLCAMPLSR